MKIKNNKALPKLILIWSKRICNSFKKDKKPKRGRPPLYQDQIIIAALLLKILKGSSLRKLEEDLKELFPKVPDFTTLWYRFRKLEKSYLMEMIRRSAKEIMRVLKAKEFHCLVADGTGFGYGETYYMKWLKGQKLRKVRSHVKAVVLVGMVRGKEVVVGVNVGRAYSDENKLLMPMLEGLDFRAKYFLGDAYYGRSVEVLKGVKEHGMVAVVPVRETMRQKVRDEYRKWAKENYELRRKVYRKRWRVGEWPTGTVKNTTGDRDNVKDFHVASLYVLGRFVIYNLALLEELLLLWLKLLGHMTPSNSLSFNKMRIFPTASGSS